MQSSIVGRSSVGTTLPSHSADVMMTFSSQNTMSVLPKKPGDSGQLERKNLKIGDGTDKQTQLRLDWTGRQRSLEREAGRRPKAQRLGNLYLVEPRRLVTFCYQQKREKAFGSRCGRICGGDVDALVTGTGLAAKGIRRPRIGSLDNPLLPEQPQLLSKANYINT